MSTDRDGQEQVGSVAEEAAKLFQALQDWARESGDGQAGAATAAWKDLNDHLAHGEDCRYCPICRVIALVRGTSPEVKAHLASAATSLMQAAASAMASQVPDPARPGRREPPVEKIDLSDDAEEWGDE